MNTSSVLIIFGLSLDIIGVWLIAVDILGRPLLLNRASLRRHRKRLYLDHLEKMKQGAETWGQVYPEEEKKAYVDDMEKRWLARVREEEEEEQRQSDDFGWRGLKYAVLGLVLVTAGFSIQIVGVVVATPN